MDAKLEAQREQVLALLNDATTVAFLTGAGVSTDSGIPDFQTLDHEWRFPVPRAEATSLSYFKRDPKSFWEAFRYIFEFKTAVQPNAFHRAVAGLEAKGKEVVVLTQNVDGLHKAAGSSQVGELHGNLRWAKCSRPSCPERKSMEAVSGDPLPRCTRCRKLLRPDTVLFGEAPHHFGDAKQVCLEADVLLVAGTALEVGPVNDLPRYREWWREGAPTVWMNRHQPPADYNFTHHLYGELTAAAEVLSAVEESAHLGETPLPPLP